MTWKKLEYKVKHLINLYEHNYITWYELYGLMCRLQEKTEKEADEK